MAEDSALRGTFAFLNKIGIFDVVLPFLLVFTIVFAILEKTRVFGTEKVGSNEYTKKNLNSLASFAIALFTVASGKVVEAITQISANVVILLFASVFFLMLVGSFHPQGDEKGFFLEKGMWRTFFVLLMFIGLVGIFLNALESGGMTWLQIVLDWFSQFFTNVSVATAVLIGFVVLAMWWIAKPEHPPAKT
ncbi:hypothetical protein HYU17_01675 [Candidatus Woesearchaeota archaeon]|nr:hypothetical protein [Candidatus Woesearchaeota archaeon]